MRHLIAVLGLAVAALACGAPPGAAGSQSPASSPASAAPASAPASVEVVVNEVNATGRGGAFEAPTVTVKVGDTVTWVNASGNVHNVTFQDQSVHPSSIMYGKDKFSMTFTKPGAFAYRCTFHPGMDGSVIVTSS